MSFWKIREVFKIHLKELIIYLCCKNSRNNIIMEKKIAYQK